MSESHLAEAAGLQLKHVTELESGQLELTNSRDLVKIARALDVPLAELTGEVPAFRKNLAGHQVASSIREILLERDFLSLLRDGTVELSSVYLEEFAERLEEV
jgi:transcriptional regulator with XRE-family HTH domain